LPSEVYIRRPALTVVFALAIGILLNYHNPLPLLTWLSVGAVSLLTLLAARRSIVISSVAVFAMFVAIGGARHECFWSLRSEDDIARFVDQQPNVVRVRGQIVTEIEILEADQTASMPVWMRVDRSRCWLRCEEFWNNGTWETVSGTVQLSVDGQLVNSTVGDHVEVLGKLMRPRPPDNPGDFDYPRYLRMKRIDAILATSHPIAVKTVRSDNGIPWIIARQRNRIRDSVNDLFTQRLSNNTRPVAMSILLGDRTRMTDELRTQFVQSGTMHLLAISGLHIGILVAFLFLLCRGMNLSSRMTAIVMITCVLSYALLTNHRPPVLRATMLATITFFGYARARRIDGMNTLAICAMILLIWKPTDLFDVGAQLSFLAVGAIIWSGKLTRRPAEIDSETALHSEGMQLISRLAPSFRWMKNAYIMTASIWLVTMPLTIYAFNIVAPIGVILNVLLIPFVAICLAFGYLFVLIGMVSPWAATPFAYLFEGTLQTLLWSVDGARALPLSHFHVTDIPLWWIIGVYAIIGVQWQLIGSVTTARWATRVLPVWILIGLSSGLFSSVQSEFPRDLRCTFLSVGHGLAVVVELPTGEVLLFDAGNSGDGRRSSRTIESFLASRGTSRIDTLIISHADHDHFNGAFDLMEFMPVGQILVSQPFLDFEQHEVHELMNEAAQREIPIHIAAAGDTIVRGESNTPAGEVNQLNSPQFRFLHPLRGFHSQHDNANSFVLEIEYAHRTILLTGDLEKAGLSRFLEGEIKSVDVMLSPHHGSAKANPAELYRQLQPEHVIISSGDANAIETVAALAGEGPQVWSTDRDGSVTVTITTTGDYSVEPFRPRLRNSP